MQKFICPHFCGTALVLQDESCSSSKRCQIHFLVSLKKIKYSSLWKPGKSSVLLNCWPKINDLDHQVLPEHQFIQQATKYLFMRRHCWFVYTYENNITSFCQLFGGPVRLTSFVQKVLPNIYKSFFVTPCYVLPLNYDILVLDIIVCHPLCVHIFHRLHHLYIYRCFLRRYWRLQKL